MRDIDPTASEYIASGYLERSRPGGVLYDIGSIIGSVAGPLIGGFLGSSSASDAGEAQERGAARSDATNRYIYDQTRADNAAARARGDAAGNRLGYLMGLDAGVGSTGGVSGSAGPALTRESLRSELLGRYTSPGSMGRGSIGQTGDSEGIPYVDYSPSESVVNEAAMGSEIDRRMAEQQTRQSAAQAAASRDPAYGSLSRSFSEAAPASRRFGQDEYNNDYVAQTGLQFGLDQGRQGIERQQQASGSLLSGATLKALSRFGNDYGTKNAAGAYDRFTGEQARDYGQYTDRYNRYNADQGTQFNRLSGLAGSGQAATGMVGAAGQNYANAVGQTALGLGNAQGAAAIAQGNAWSGGIQSGINNYQTNRLLNGMQSTRGSSGNNYGGSSSNPFSANYENSFDRM